MMSLISHSKFFGKPNGAKPAAPQQSKLAFSSKPAATKEDAKENEPTSSSEEVKRPAVKQEADEAMPDASQKDVAAPSKTESTAAAKKRSVEEDEDSHSGASDGSEPPTKKTKTKAVDTKVLPMKTQGSPAIKPSPKVKESPAPVAAKRSRGISKRKVVEEDEDEEEVAAPASKKLPQQQVKAEVKEEEEEEEEEDKPTSSENSASDEEAELESEDEKPELAAKKREKVQATLQADGKDPYPDWKAGDPVPYAALCTTFSKIELTTKRLEIAAHCSRFLRQVMRLTPDDLTYTVLLMINKLAADYAGIELGIGESLIMKAIGESTGRTLQVIKNDQKQIGDLGLVAAKSRGNQPTMLKPKPLTVRSVHKGLMDIATMSGSGAQGQKVSGIKKLLSAADATLKGKVDITKDKGGPSEAKFIVRMLEGKLRLGLADKTVLVALAQALVFHEAAQNGKVPSSEQLAKGESILKSVYRYDRN
jgi:DNA ligase-1